MGHVVDWSVVCLLSRCGVTWPRKIGTRRDATFFIYTHLPYLLTSVALDSKWIPFVFTRSPLVMWGRRLSVSPYLHRVGRHRSPWIEVVTAGRGSLLSDTINCPFLNQIHNSQCCGVLHQVYQLMKSHWQTRFPGLERTKLKASRFRVWIRCKQNVGGSGRALSI